MTIRNQRILLLGEDLKPGGASVVVLRVQELLGNWGYSVDTIIGHPDLRTDLRADVIVDLDAINGGWGMRGRVAEIAQARRLIKRYQPDCVIIHAMSPGYMYAMMYSRLPVLYHLHTKIDPRPNIMRRLFYPRVRDEMKRIIVVSEWQRKNILTEWGVREHMVKLLHNYPTRRVVMQEEGDIILTAARLHWAKNPTLWRDVGALLNDFLLERGLRMVWCAPFISREDREEFASLPSEMQLVEIREQSVLARYFSRAVLYYQPSTIDLNPIAVLEAMQNGIPCLVTEDTGMTDAVTDGLNGRVLPQGNATAHARAIIDAISDDTQLASWSAHARATIEEGYTAMAWNKTYEELLFSVLHEAR